MACFCFFLCSSFLCNSCLGDTHDSLHFIFYINLIHSMSAIDRFLISNSFPPPKSRVLQTTCPIATTKNRLYGYYYGSKKKLQTTHRWIGLFFLYPTVAFLGPRSPKRARERARRRASVSESLRAQRLRSPISSSWVMPSQADSDGVFGGEVGQNLLLIHFCLRFIFGGF